jgi:hypothetical protein
MNNKNTADDTIVIDRVEATGAKRVKGMPYVLGLSISGTVLLLVISTIIFSYQLFP